MSESCTQSLRAAAAIVGLVTLGGGLTAGVATATVDQPRLAAATADRSAAGHDAEMSEPYGSAAGTESGTELFQVPKLSASSPGPGSWLGFGTDYRGPHDDGFDDDATGKDYANRHGPSRRRGCADSDDPANYNDCSTRDFRAGGPNDGDGYDNSDRRLEDDDVPAEQAPRSLFTNKKRDRHRQLSPPGSFFQ